MAARRRVKFRRLTLLPRLLPASSGSTILQARTGNTAAAPPVLVLRAGDVGARSTWSDPAHASARKSFTDVKLPRDGLPAPAACPACAAGGTEEYACGTDETGNGPSTHAARRPQSNSASVTRGTGRAHTKMSIDCVSAVRVSWGGWDATARALRAAGMVLLTHTEKERQRVQRAGNGVRSRSKKVHQQRAQSNGRERGMRRAHNWLAGADSVASCRIREPGALVREPR